MTQPILAKIHAYWDELRAGRLMPLRSEIDPREMSPFLEVCFVLERVTSDSVRFRLAGHDISALMGMEVRGMPLNSMIEPQGRDLFDAQLNAVFDTPEVQRYNLVSVSPGASQLDASLLILPLRSEDGGVDRAIGSLTSTGAVGAPPRRFHVTELQRTSLTTGLTQTDAYRPAAHAGTEFAEAQAPFEAASPAPYLRVVK